MACCTCSWLMVNHKPVVKDDSRGFWRRVRLIPFTKNFDPHQEPTLESTLMAEAPGILAWAIRGAADWYKRGLSNPPACVLAATKEYQRESDTLAGWKEDCCIEGEHQSTTGNSAYSSYVSWAEREKLSPRETLSKMGFFKKLASVFVSKHIRSGTVYFGISVTGNDQLNLNIEGEKE